MNNLSYSEHVRFFKEKIVNYKSNNLKVFASSSFQSHSIPMLHILSEIDNTIPVYFLNTGYHFPETLDYKNEIAQLFNLNIISLDSPIPKILQRDKQQKLYFASDPDYCCYLNKVLPLEPIILQHDVWISGVRKDQNNNRKTFSYEATGKHGILRFHPMLEWNNRLIWKYIKDFNLPQHPLHDKGYISIGCEPCTQKFNFLDERQGRWQGLNKTECGLHTDLTKPKI